MPDPRTTTLFDAVTSGSGESVTAALASGAPVDARDGDGWTALDRAAGRGDAAMVGLLLEHGADPLAVGPERRTAYEIALAAGRLDAARVLRTAQERADPTMADNRLWRPYCKAYPLEQLRAAPMWREPDQADDLTDDTVVYLHDDHTVTRMMWPGEDVIFAGVDDGWIAFCADVLRFRVPEDIDLVPDAQSMGSS